MQPMSAQARRVHKTKSTVPVCNGQKKPTGKQSTLWEGRYTVRSNHQKTGVQHFSV